MLIRDESLLWFLIVDIMISSVTDLVYSIAIIYSILFMIKFNVLSQGNFLNSNLVTYSNGMHLCAIYTILLYLDIQLAHYHILQYMTSRLSV